MKRFSQFRLETGRLLRARPTWLAVGLTALSPAVGLVWYRPLLSASGTEYVTSTLGACVANPALAGGLLGAICFAVLTVWELSRAHRSEMDTLTDAVSPPMTAALVRLAALLCVSAAAQAITMLLWLPYTVSAAGAVFDAKSYVLLYLLFMYGPIPLAILIASCAWQFTRRVELSLALFAALAALSLTAWSENWQLCWLNPCVWMISDDFSNNRLLRSVAYAKLGWLLALSGLWCLSYLCIRRYGKGILGSLAQNSRRVYRPLLAALLLVCAGLLYVGQPFLDHSAQELDYSALFCEEFLQGVTCSARYADVRPDPRTGRLSGTETFTLQNTTGQAQTIQLRLNPGYSVSSVQANGEDVPFSLAARPEMNWRPMLLTLPAAPEIELTVCYGGLPQEWNIASSPQGGMEISEQYMELENEVLAPSLYDVWYQGDTLPATMDITLPEHMTPVLFGLGSTALLRQNEDGTRTWRMTDDGYNMIVFAGDYICEDIAVESAGVTVHFYYARKHQPIMQAADAAGQIRRVVEYCTEHYGPLSFYGDGAFRLIENRGSGGGYATYGASLANEMDFTAQNLSDSKKGAAAGEVFIHELVHQWWGLGNMFDPMDDELWSSEGLTTYTTYRIIKQLYGEQAAKTRFTDQWQQEVDSYYKNFYVRNPEALNALPERYQAEIANRLRGVRQYSEMPLKILKAEKLVGGEAAMDEILSGLFNRELDPSYPYLRYQDFLDACGLTEEDLSLD